MKARLLLAAAALVPVLAGGGIIVRELAHVGIHRGYAPAQPIAFSHRLHAGTNQVPCQYCHSGVRTSRHAGIPSASVCMNCHSLLERQTVDIEKLKEAVQQQRPIVWNKVHNLPEFVYFNHSQHVLSGVACRQCHGAVETMDRIEQVKPLTMGWCLDCHRDHAGVPKNGIVRASLGLHARPRPVPGLDCGKCHY